MKIHKKLFDKNVENKKYAMFLFLFSPFLAFIFSIRNYKVHNYHKYIFLFCMFYALTYIPAPNSDATRYESRVESMDPYTLTSYVNEITNMYQADAEYNDAYVHTVFLILSPITNNILIYRLFFALIYFTVFLSLIKEMKSTRYTSSPKFNWFILGVIFLISFSSGINGVRFPLALMVFILGYFKYIKLNEKKYLLLASLSFLIHFMMGYLVLFLFIYILTKKFYKPVMALVLLGIFFMFSLTFSSGVKDASSLIGDGIESKTMSYSENEDYKEGRELHLQKVNWYVTLNRYSTNYFVLFALAISIYFVKQRYKSKLLIKLEYFAVLMFIASFISGQLLDTLSNRFYLSANAAGLIYLYCLYDENRTLKIVDRLRMVYIPIVMLHVLIVLRGDLYTVSPNLIFGNIFTEMYYSFDKSIQDYLL